MLYATFGSPVNARLETVWNLLLDKAENPQKYIPQSVEEVKVLERYKDGLLRLMETSEVHIKERITVDEQTKEVTFTLLDHPVYTGKLINKIIATPDGNSQTPLLLTYIVALHPLSEEAQKNNPSEARWFQQIATPETIQQAVLHMKNIAEHQDYQNGTTTKQTKPMLKTLLEKKHDSLTIGE